MSLYNKVNGMNPCVFFILPMLGHPPIFYPRFRDCFIEDKDYPETKNKIIVYTRTGGGNREEYEKENKKLTQMETYLFDYDDDFDNTYANFVFDVPEKWKKDFDFMMKNERQNVSEDYIKLVLSFYPQGAESINEFFYS